MSISSIAADNASCCYKDEPIGKILGMNLHLIAYLYNLMHCLKPPGHSNLSSNRNFFVLFLGISAWTSESHILNASF